METKKTLVTCFHSSQQGIVSLIVSNLLTLGAHARPPKIDNPASLVVPRPHSLVGPGDEDNNPACHILLVITSFWWLIYGFSSNNLWTVWTCPFIAAISSGTLPCCILYIHTQGCVPMVLCTSVFVSWISAPALISRSTIFVWPSWLAAYTGLLPLCSLYK